VPNQRSCGSTGPSQHRHDRHLCEGGGVTTRRRRPPFPGGRGITSFAKTLSDRVEGFITIRRSLGYSFQKQASVLRALVRYVEAEQIDGPMTQELALNFVFSRDGTTNGRAIRHSVVRRFAEYLVIYDPQTEALDSKALPKRSFLMCLRHICVRDSQHRERLSKT
jgi:hypothetical protein